MTNVNNLDIIISLTGIGLSLTTPQCAVITKQYFVEYRTIVTAFATTLASLLSLGVPFLIQYFFNNFSPQLGFLLWTSVFVQSIVFAALFQPVEMHKKLRPVLSTRPTYDAGSENATASSFPLEESPLNQTDISEDKCEDKRDDVTSDFSHGITTPWISRNLT